MENQEFDLQYSEEKTFKEYHAMLLFQSWDNFKKDWLSWKTVWIFFFNLFIASIVVTIVNKPKTLSEFVKTESMLTILTTVVFSVIVGIVVYLSHLRKQYAYVYNNQAKKIQDSFPENLNIRISNSKSGLWYLGGELVPTVLLQVFNQSEKKRIIEIEGKIKNFLQIYVDSETKKLAAIPFQITSHCLWDGKDKKISIMPEETALLSVSATNKVDFDELFFGEMGFNVIDKFKEESVYILSMDFTGRYDEEADYRRQSYNAIVYCHPSEKVFLNGKLALKLSPNMNYQLRKVIENSYLEIVDVDKKKES